MAFLRFLLSLPFVIVLILFAIANRQDISVVWSPFYEALDVPAYALALGTMAAGFLIGAFFTWFSMGKLRKDRRRQKKIIQSLEKKLESANENETPLTISDQGERHVQ